jgi:hypothetical protein
MDYIDPAKERRHRLTLIVGYFLVAVVIILGARILLYQASGYGIKQGKVIQNGLTFFSSQPNPANIYVNGKLAKKRTNTRLYLPSGIYTVQLKRDGYRTWQRKIELEGGEVQHFDYPFLFPTTLTGKKQHDYSAAPLLATQSPDHRWWLIQPPGSLNNFELYDLKNPQKLVTTSLALPAGVLTKAAAQENLVLAEWADDNRHVLLQHNYDGKTEYILLDRTNPEASINLSTKLSTTASKIELANKKFDRYFLYDPASKLVQSATIDSPAPVPILQHVLAYQSYGTDTFLYFSDDNVTAGKVALRMLTGSTTTQLRTFPAGSNYLVDLTKYSGDLYIVVGASSENKLYIYKDPIGQLNAVPKHALIPSQVLHVIQPNYVSFSDNAQFIVAENGSQFGVYDIENEKGYNYSSELSLDAPQVHASWMDGDRLLLTSGGKLIVFDYDHTNQQTLVTNNPAFLPAFAPDSKYLYTLAPAPTAGQTEIDQTPLLAPADR